MRLSQKGAGNHQSKRRKKKNLLSPKKTWRTFGRSEKKGYVCRKFFIVLDLG
jgi:hypothetical protein